MLSATAVAGIALFFVFDRERRTRLATEARLSRSSPTLPIRSPFEPLGRFRLREPGLPVTSGARSIQTRSSARRHGSRSAGRGVGQEAHRSRSGGDEGETSAFEHIFPGFGDPVTVEFQLFRCATPVARSSTSGAIGTDVTARDRQEQALRRATARAKAAMRDAEAANRAKTSFLATMSHELHSAQCDSGVLGSAAPGSDSVVGAAR